MKTFIHSFHPFFGLLLAALSLSGCITLIPGTSIHFDSPQSAGAAAPLSSAGADGDGLLTVATFNLKSGDTDDTHINAARRQMQAYGAQIIGIQEMDSDDSFRISGKPYIRELVQSPFIDYQFVPALTLPKGGLYGEMILSALPITAKSSLVLPRFAPPVFAGEDRILIRSLIRFGDKEIAFYNTHLAYEDSPWMRAKTVRRLQLEHIKATLDADPCPYKIITGDFNIESFFEFYPLLSEGGYRCINNPKTPFNSYRGDDCTFKCLDNIFFSPAFECVDSGIADNEISDHNMLFAKLRLKTLQ